MSSAAVLSKERSIQVWEAEGGALARRSTPASAEGLRARIVNSSERDVRAPVAAFGAAFKSTPGTIAKTSSPGYPKLKNDHGVPEIRIGARKFECIGESPPNDHPHVHIDMGSQDTILCPYCGTRYRMDAALSARGQADPPDSLFEDAATDPDALRVDPPTAHRPVPSGRPLIPKENQNVRIPGRRG